MGALAGVQAVGSQYSVPSSSDCMGQGPSSLIRQICPVLEDSVPLARLEQGSLGHCLQSWAPIAIFSHQALGERALPTPVVITAFPLSPALSHPLPGPTDLGSDPSPTAGHLRDLR